MVFSATYPWGSSAPSAFPSTGSGLRFPPLISCEKTAPFRQSLQKSPSSFLGCRELSRFAEVSKGRAPSHRSVFVIPYSWPRKGFRKLTFGKGDLIIPLMGGRYGKYGEVKRLARLRKGRKEAERVAQHERDSMRKERLLRKRFGRIKPEEVSKEQ